MHMIILKEYINKLTISDLDKFTKQNSIYLNQEELNIIYYYIKNKYKEFLNNQEKILNELRKEITPLNYQKIYNLYDQYKEKIRNYFP